MELTEDLQKLKQLFHGGNDVDFRNHVREIVSNHIDEESQRLINQCIEELIKDTGNKIERLNEDCIRIKDALIHGAADA